MTPVLKRLALACGLVAAVALAHAQTPHDQQQTSSATYPHAVSAGIAAKLIVRGELQGLQVIDLRSQRRNDMLVVQAEVSNRSNSDLRLYYRFRWTDADGMQVGDGETWKPLVFLGQQTMFIKGTAYGPKATDFMIEMSAEPR